MSNDYELITTFPQRHSFAKTLTETAEKHLLDNTKLYVYFDGVDLPEDTNKVKYISWDPVDAKTFLQRAAPIQTKMAASQLNIYSPEYDKAQGWMYHATRFCWKVYAMAEHALACKSRYMVWIDSDVEFISDVSEDWFSKLHPEGYYSSFLGRPLRYTETGFLSFDTHHHFHKQFWNEMKRSYDDLTIFDIEEGWTDCHVYDRTKKIAEIIGVKFFDIVLPKYKLLAAPAWKHTDLALHTLHHKGPSADKS